MSADDKRNEQTEEARHREDLQRAEAAEQEAGGQNEEASGEEVSAGESELDILQQQVADAQEQVVRTQAEMQNVRRRADIDAEKARKFAVERFVKELLPVADSLEKAVESAQGKSASDDVVASIREGAEMTLDLFLASLEKFNVKVVNPVGEPFDPQLHEAMSMVPSPESEPNSVVAVIQKGYTLNERLVRPAMVMVAKPDDSAKIDEQA